MIYSLLHQGKWIKRFSWLAVNGCTLILMGSCPAKLISDNWPVFLMQSETKYLHRVFCDGLSLKALLLNWDMQITLRGRINRSRRNKSLVLKHRISPHSYEHRLDDLVMPRSFWLSTESDGGVAMVRDSLCRQGDFPGWYDTWGANAGGFLFFFSRHPGSHKTTLPTATDLLLFSRTYRVDGIQG